MLRGFWLAVVVLGMLVQWTTMQFMFKTTGIAESMFLVAWGAAALYAVGAAVTLFSAETEEQTRNFLLNLPGRWLPMFAAKVTMALVSAFSLGILLCAIGGWIGGGKWVVFQNVMAVGVVTVLEATAWGLLFSLWMKQPLLAAVLAIGAASFGTQLAVAATPGFYHTLTLQAYRDAIPMRLLLVLAVFATNLWLGARWLKIAPRRAKVSRGKTTAVAAAPQKVCRGLMARLLWQTWRESWKTMLLAIPIAMFLMVALAMPLMVFRTTTPSADLPMPMLVLFFLPALLGALVFRADQRDDHRQFLVAHAARPRYVWLARHLFWGTGLLAITFVASLAISLVLALWFTDWIYHDLTSGFGSQFFNFSPLEHILSNRWQAASLLEQTIRFAVQCTYASWTSFFTAYALGQFCSLMLRREVLAGLLALLLSVVLVAWTMVVGFWQLNSCWFVLPIGIGAMLATWLRMPHWMVGRNHPRTWILPIAAMGVPLAMVVTTLPSARLAQLQERPSHARFMEEVRKFESNRAAAQTTANAYVQLYVSLEETKNTIDRQAVLEKLIELTKQLECRFPESANLYGNPLHRQIAELQDSLFSDAQRLQQAGDLDAALERYLAMVRLKSHQLRGQQTSALRNVSWESRFFNQRLLEWATHPDQTSKRLRKALSKLKHCPAILDPRKAILADREKIRAVLLGDESPSFLNEKHPRWSGYLAYLANDLPGERQRALLALDIRTRQILDHVMLAIYGANAYGSVGNAITRREFARQNSQDSLPHQLVYGRDWYAYHLAAQNAWQTLTSYLVTKELFHRMHTRNLMLQALDARTRRVGLSAQLALLSYRLDHQRYPESLAELVPKYLQNLPLDPYSDRLLEYRPEGFDLPLLKFGLNSELLPTEVTSSTIPAHTPLLWSVGINNCKPRERRARNTRNEPSKLSSEEEEVTIKIIRLLPAEGLIWQSPILFPLPKIEPSEAPSVDEVPESPKENDAEKPSDTTFLKGAFEKNPFGNAPPDAQRIKPPQREEP